MYKKLIKLTILIFWVTTHTYAQRYTFRKLATKNATRTVSPTPVRPKMQHDTTFTIYGNCSIPIIFYFVDGSGEYNNLFNPHPTGLFLNNKHFRFYADPAKKYPQNVSNFLDVYEMDFMKKTYLVFMNFREDCIGEGCRYHCFNIFDITNPDNITQTAFSSIYKEIYSFGDFNSDGILDFMRAAPKMPDGGDIKRKDEYYLLTAYTFDDSKTVLLKNDKGREYYLWAEGDKDLSEFTVFQQDWMFPVKSKEGKALTSTDFHPPYISFDPSERHMFNSEGVMIEKKKWSLKIGVFSDLEGAQKFVHEMENRRHGDIFIMADQYGGQIMFEVLFGNYRDKEKAYLMKESLKKLYHMTAKYKDLQAKF